MRDALIYCDGSADQDGFGGAAAFLLANGKERFIVEGYRPGTLGASGRTPGVYAKVTNQQMEIMAAILGLSKLKKERRYKVLLRTDSQYIIRCFLEGWLDRWRAKDWRHKGGERPNRVLWETLESLVMHHKVEFEHVYGHKGDRYNERADKVAGWARLESRTTRGDVKVYAKVNSHGRVVCRRDDVVLRRTSAALNRCLRA